MREESEFQAEDGCFFCFWFFVRADLSPLCLRRIGAALRPAVGELGKCESELRVLSCQDGSRQQRGPNELSVCVLFRDRLLLDCARETARSFL